MCDSCDMSLPYMGPRTQNVKVLADAVDSNKERIAELEAKVLLLREALYNAPSCDPEQHYGGPPTPDRRSRCFDCSEWCYASTGMGCYGCDARRVLEATK